MNKKRSRADVKVGDAWRRLYDTSDGRLVVADLLVWCNVHTPIETNDPLELARLNGERNVALRVMAFLNRRPEVFVPEAQEDTDILEQLMRSN